MQYKLGELFCGAGGLALGAKSAKVITNESELFSILPTWANDVDHNACETYQKNIAPDNPEKVICKKVAQLDMEKLPAIDALAFGFPCNDFSGVGKQKGTNGSYGSLYKYCVDALRHFQPKWFLAENVRGLRNANSGNDFKIILLEMAQAGYNIFPHLYHFEKYGIPQSRHRIVIVGIRKDINHLFRVPAVLETAPITCKEALENPPIPIGAPNQKLTRHAKHIVERLKHTKPGENAFTANLPDHLKLKVKGAKMSTIYKRLDPEKPSYTVTGSGGGGTHMYHWIDNRALTNRERARLQTFPDYFEFSGSKESIRKQIGMAVPPEGSKIIFEAILKTFAGIEYKSTKTNIKPIFWDIIEDSKRLQ